MSMGAGDPPPFPPSWPPYVPSPSQYGWICPRCNVVHAPTVQQCNCQYGYPYGPTVSGGQG